MSQLHFFIFKIPNRFFHHLSMYKQVLLMNDLALEVQFVWFGQNCFFCCVIKSRQFVTFFVARRFQSFILESWESNWIVKVVYLLATNCTTLLSRALAKIMLCTLLFFNYFVRNYYPKADWLFYRINQWTRQITSNQEGMLLTLIWNCHSSTGKFYWLQKCLTSLKLLKIYIISILAPHFLKAILSICKICASILML